jgi:hypothetical protein
MSGMQWYVILLVIMLNKYGIYNAIPTAPSSWTYAMSLQQRVLKFKQRPLTAFIALSIGAVGRKMELIRAR